MNITIIDGNPTRADGPFDTYMTGLTEGLQSRSHQVEHFRLSQLNLHLCTGCWTCWVKTPGRCSQKDDAIQILTSYLASDLVVFATPLRLGFVSGVMKGLIDRLVPLFLPPIELYRKECVHSQRYDRYPALGCLLHRGEYEDEDVDITREYLRRYAFHFQTDLALDATSDMTTDEVCRAIDSL
jgi:multimeric flavodoxin WrbA